MDDLRIEINSLKTELSDLSATNTRLENELDHLTATGNDGNRQQQSYQLDSDSSGRSQQHMEMLREQVSGQLVRHTDRQTESGR